MTYYCFLCNENHDDSPTEEHFLPKCIDGPEDQWLPVCKASNTRSNSVFDKYVRDILYMTRYQNTKVLKRTGEALLGNGTLKNYKFSCDETRALERAAAFDYFFDRESNRKIPSNDICAIRFLIGLTPEEQKKFRKGLSKISIGALAYLLRKEGVPDETIRQIFSQTSIELVRHFALDLPWSGNYHIFPLGRTDVLSQLQLTCKNPQISNHVIQIKFKENYSIHIEGMLYSKYGWEINLSNDVPIDIAKDKLRLENPIPGMPVPEDRRDMTLSPASICIINPSYKGQKPDIPQHWKNRSV